MTPRRTIHVVASMLSISILMKLSHDSLKDFLPNLRIPVLKFFMPLFNLLNLILQGPKDLVHVSENSKLGFCFFHKTMIGPLQWHIVATGHCHSDSRRMAKRTGQQETPASVGLFLDQFVNPTIMN